MLAVDWVGELRVGAPGLIARPASLPHGKRVGFGEAEEGDGFGGGGGVG